MKTLDDRLLALEATVADLRACVESLARATGLYASDKELDGPYGDPTPKFDPKQYRGPSCKGRPMSRCTPEFLEAYADALAYSAEHPKPGKEKYAQYDRLDAARARAWARRLRSGWKPPLRDDGDQSSGDDAPFGSAAPSRFEPPRFEAPAFDAPSGFDADDDIPF